jgi:hypothetical protein
MTVDEFLAWERRQELRYECPVPQHRIRRPGHQERRIRRNPLDPALRHAGASPHRRTVFARDGANWVGTVLLDDAELAMPEIGGELPLRDLYAGVELPPPETDD